MSWISKWTFEHILWMYQNNDHHIYDIKMLEIFIKYKFEAALTEYFLQKLSAPIVHREPSRRRCAINIVGFLTLWENIGYVRAVFHANAGKANASTILGQPNIAPQGCVRGAHTCNKQVSIITGIRKKAWEPALGNDCWSLAWNNEMIISVRLEECQKYWKTTEPKLPHGHKAVKMCEHGHCQH